MRSDASAEASTWPVAGFAASLADGMLGAAWMPGYAAELAGETSLRMSALAGTSRVEPGAEASAGLLSLCVASCATLPISNSGDVLASTLCDAITPSGAAGFQHYLRKASFLHKLLLSHRQQIAVEGVLGNASQSFCPGSSLVTLLRAGIAQLQWCRQLP